jgi:hypothetical protein
LDDDFVTFGRSHQVLDKFVHPRDVLCFEGGHFQGNRRVKRDPGARRAPDESSAVPAGAAGEDVKKSEDRK